MRPDYTSSEFSPQSHELAAAVGRILFEQVHSGDVGQVLEEMDVPLLRELELHVLIFDRPMKDWLDSMGLPALEDKDCFWTGMVLPMIEEELEKRVQEPS